MADAFAELKKFLESYGIVVGKDLESVLTNIMTSGYTAEDIDLFMPEIEKTTSFQARFPGYSARQKNGYSAISLGDYINLENEYHRIMQSAGMPKSFYDSPQDYGSWIANDVSPDEINTRVAAATSIAQRVDPTMRTILAQAYGIGTGDLAAYALDPAKAGPILNDQKSREEAAKSVRDRLSDTKRYLTAPGGERQTSDLYADLLNQGYSIADVERMVGASGVAAAAAGSGMYSGSINRFEDLFQRGVTAQQAEQGYGRVGQFNNALSAMAARYGETYDQTAAEEDVFFNDTEKRERIVRQEAAQFQGSGRAGATGRSTRQSY